MTDLTFTRLGAEAQNAIYLQGLQGARPEIPSAFANLETRARDVMSPEAWAYVAGGAGLESTMAANRCAFDRFAIAPRMLHGAATRDLRVELFGRHLPTPLLTAPIGVLDLAHAHGDLGVARAAAKLGAPMIISSQASTPMEAIAAELGDNPRWFQLYWGKSDALARSFVERAEACGCSAIVITLDTTMLGWRPRDLDLGYLPFLRGRGIAQYTSDPVFQTLLPAGAENNEFAGPMVFTQVFSEPALDWARIRQIRDWTKLPVLLKGILRADDAEMTIAEGYDGLIVSNHGGRQIDGAVGALSALPDVVAAVAGRAPVLFDSGVRCGADIFKALALGAAAVCIGRPYVYGLTLGGDHGAAAVLTNLAAELDLTMGLSGCARIGDITPTALRPAA
jgi:lactate 2-monooxygenase